MLHKITHKHKVLHKPGVGEIKFCSGRFRNRKKIDVSVSMDELYDTVYVIHDIWPREMEAICSCSNETELANVIVEIIQARRNGPEPVVMINEGHLLWAGEKQS